MEEIKTEKDEEKDVEMVVFSCSFEDFGNLQKGLEEKNLEVKESELVRIPTHTKKLQEEQVEDVIKLIDKMEDDDDVINVFHNMDME